MSFSTQQSPRLPFFYDGDFSWEALEGFFCDFCNAQPRVWTTKYADRVKIIAAEMVGRRGGSQAGVDLILRTEHGETWYIECKHRKSWREGQSENVIQKAASRSADRFILALTCNSSEKTKDVIRAEESWDLWDPTTIDLIFSQLVDDDPIAASRLIHRWFGLAWLSAFNLKPSVALISTDAHYATFDQDIFHHRLPIIGREQELENIRQFLDDPEQRAFIISARGGLGKSRLLREIASLTGKQKCKRSIWFAESGTRDRFQEELAQIGGSPVVVLDDAHRTDFYTDLLTAVAHLPTAKVIIGTRPQAHAAMRTTLSSSGFTATQISELHLKGLKFDDAVRLSEAALGENHKRHANKLAKLSHDCPLVTVVGAGLIKKNPNLGPDLLKNEDDFRSDVFDKLLTVLPEENRHRLMRLCQWIAALAPVKNEIPFREKAAEFLDWTPTDVEGAIGQLEETGLLVTLSEGMRVIPDLLSDHLLYEACRDPSKGFVIRIVDTLGKSTPQLTLIRNLAEVEWRSQQNGISAQSIIAPLWRDYLRDFRSATFVQRWTQLREWETFAKFLPAEALELTDATIETIEEPPKSEASPRGDYDWAATLKSLPSVLEPIAFHSRQYKHQALDALWRLYSMGEIPKMYANAPLKTIARVAEHGSNQGDYLNWLETTLLSDSAADLLASPAEEFAGLLSPLLFYELSRPAPSTVQLSQPLRPRVTQLIRALIDRGNTTTVLNFIPVLERGIRRPYPHKGLSVEAQSLIDAALEDRRANLKELLRLAKNEEHPVIYFIVRRAIRQLLTEHPNHRETGAFFDECGAAVDTIGALGGFDLRLAICTFSNEFEEFAHFEDENLQANAEQLWQAFNQEVGGQLLEKNGNTSSLIAALESLSESCAELGFTPRFWSLFQAILAKDPGIANQLASHALTKEESSFSESIGALLSPEKRENLLEQALTSPHNAAAAGLLRSALISRIMNPLSDTERQLILKLVAEGGQAAVDSAISSIVVGRPQPPYAFELELLRQSTKSPLDPKTAPALLRALTIFAKAEPDRFVDEVVEELLQALVTFKSLGGPDSIHNLQIVSKIRPDAVFEFLFSRAEEAAKQAPDLYYSAFNYDSMGVVVQGSVTNLAEKAERLLSSLELHDRYYSGEPEFLGSLLRKSGDEGAAVVSSWIDKAASESRDKLIKLMRILSSYVNYPFWKRPDIVERVLKLGRNHSCHEELRSNLSSSGIVGFSRGMRGGEIDDRWSNDIQRLRDLKRRFKGNPLLESFYSALVAGEEQTIKSMGQHRTMEPDY